jgi:large subunit ribosomal protein L29
VKATELRDKTDVELANREKDLSEQLFKLRFQKSMGTQENPMKIRQVRREIARIKTILVEKTKSKAAK